MQLSAGMVLWPMMFFMKKIIFIYFLFLTFSQSAFAYSDPPSGTTPPNGAGIFVINSARSNVSLLSSLDIAFLLTHQNGTKGGFFVVRDAGDGVDKVYFGTEAVKAVRILTNAVEQVSILADSRVGIGSSTPGKTLTVNGDLNLTDTFSNNSGILSLPWKKNLPAETQITGVTTTDVLFLQSTALDIFTAGKALDVRGNALLRGAVILRTSPGYSCSTSGDCRNRLMGTGRADETADLISRSGGLSCENTIRGVTIEMKRSKVPTRWEGAQAGCPKGWWVCSATERAGVNCGTGGGATGFALTSAQYFECQADGSGTNLGKIRPIASLDASWIAEGQFSGLGTATKFYGWAIKSDGTDAALSTSEVCDVVSPWCCRVKQSN